MITEELLTKIDQIVEEKVSRAIARLKVSPEPIAINTSQSVTSVSKSEPKATTSTLLNVFVCDPIYLFV